MNIEQNILKVALLGTNNYQFNSELFPQEIQNFLETSASKEQVYLDALTLYTAYFEAGVKLDKIEGISKNLPTAPNEVLPACSQDMEKLLKMMLLEGSGSFISFFSEFIRVVNQEKVILPSKYFSKLTSPSKETLEAFGEKAKWIHALENTLQNARVDYLSLKKAERYQLFVNLIVAEDEEETLVFLEELFDALTPTERLKYLNVLEIRNIHSTKLMAFFETYISTHSTKSKKLEGQVKKLKFLKSDNAFFEKHYDEIFSKIWIKKRVKYSLLEQKELELLLSPLDFFTGLDETLEFIFKITPINRWVEMMGTERQVFLKEVKKSKTTYRKEKLFEAWMEQAILKKDKALLADLLELKIPIPNSGIIETFEGEEVFDFVQNNCKLFVQERIALIDMFKVHTVFHQPWRSSFSLAILKELIEGKAYFYKKEWTKAIWTIAPYLHMDGMLWMEKTLKDSKLPSELEDLEENFGEIMKMKKLFKKINIKL